jgi:hypothetical protein
MLVRYAETSGGLLYLAGGGLTWYGVATPDGPLVVNFAAALELEDSELDVQQHITAFLEDEEGELGRWDCDFSTSTSEYIAGSVANPTFAGSVIGRARLMGPHRLRLDSPHGGCLQVVHFAVRLNPS